MTSTAVSPDTIASPPAAAAPGPGAPLEFEWDGERYRVQYFLIRATSEAPATDGRTIAWLPFEEALRRLSFDNSEQLLREAQPRMDAGPHA